VLSAAPPKSTCAPLTNLLPVTVSVNAPLTKLIGITLLITGVAFQSVTSLDAFAVVSAAETASMTIVFSAGNVDGAV
jgi:hypothetical protein